MSEQTPILIRMRDASVTLGVADIYSKRLNRIQLQKFIYLLDVVSHLYSILPPRKGHLTFKHGPYDAAIQNAVDTLAFRGFVVIHGIQRDTDGNVHAVYALSRAGHSWLEKMKNETTFSVRWNAALAVAQKINSLGWYRLVDLVYAEPTFVSTRTRGFGQQLVPNDGLKNSAAFLMAVMDHALRSGFKKSQLDRTLIVDLFFRYLDEYDQIQRSLLLTHDQTNGGQP